MQLLLYIQETSLHLSMILSITSTILIQHEGCYWTVIFVAFPGPPLTPIVTRVSTGAQSSKFPLDSLIGTKESIKAPKLWFMQRAELLH